MSYRALAILAASAISIGIAQQNQPQPSPQTVLRSTTQEVLLDFIARDKHQKLVTDLRAEDIEVLEDGVPQSVRSFQYRHGRDVSVRPDGTAPAQPGAPSAPASATLREINLVSLVFEGLSPDTRKQATQAAKDFLANEVDQNTYIGVFTLNHRLALLQQYTNNIGLLNQAVDRAASGAYQAFAKETEAIVQRINSIGGDPAQFQAMRPGSAEERGPVIEDARFVQVERKMAAITLEVLTNQVGSLSLDALQRLIEVQAQLPGRKTVIYFSEGLMVPLEQPERLRAVVSAANRANISFYTVDPSGLDTLSRVRLADRVTQVINSEASGDEGGAAVKATNFQENLRTLAEDTGGSAIANTNDARVPLRRVMEEVRAHYEAAYAPTSSNYDGHFRTIEVRVHRPGIHLQSRKGYFALPMLDGFSLSPFEFNALTALHSQPAPHAFDFHAAVLTFHASAQSTECRAVFSVPSRALHFTGDAKFFHIHVAFLALVKDEQDQVVRKISRDLLFQAPADKRTDFERGEVTVTLPLRLPPGRYHLEAVANDVEGAAASTRKIALTVPASGALSDLVLVRSLHPVGEDSDATDPLESSAGKITPEMSGTISRANGAPEGVYFVLYPGTGASPQVTIAISRDGKLVSNAHPSLPPAETDGSLRILAGIPFSGFDPGVYEVTVTAAQMGATSRRTAVIEVQ